MTGVVAVLLWFAFMALLYVRFSHPANNVITSDLKIDLRPNVDTCHYCGRVNILDTCEGCGAPNPYWTPRAKTAQRRESNVRYASVGEGMISQITQAMEQAAFVPPVIFGEGDCDVDEIRGDNNVVLARVSRCRERVGPLPLPVHYPKRTSRYTPPGCREGERCRRWGDHGWCDWCTPLGPSNKIYR